MAADPALPSRSVLAGRLVILALLAGLAGCGDGARQALDARAAANGTAGPPNNGQGGRSGGSR